MGLIQQLLCHHIMRARKVLRGENLLGSVEYAVASYCINGCGKRVLDTGYSREGAEKQLKWLIKRQGLNNE